MAGHTKTPWLLCHHLRSPEHDASCPCGYRGAIWSADGDYIVLEMGSSPDLDEAGIVQGHTQPQADRATQLADAAFIFEAVNSHASLIEERDRLRAALEPFAKAGQVIDGPFGPALFAEDDMAFQSGCAWSENGERRTITWGDFRRARAAIRSPDGEERS